MNKRRSFIVGIKSTKLSAKEKKIPLYKTFLTKKNFKLPYPMMNIINGGAHANNGLRIQEFMIRPDRAKSFSDAMRICFVVIKNLQKLIKKNRKSKDDTDKNKKDKKSPFFRFEIENKQKE